MSGSYSSFTGSIPEFYHSGMGPMFFEPYAADLAARLPASPSVRVLELACGTGIVTHRLLEKLPSDGTLVSSDLNQAMLDMAGKHVPADPRLSFQVVDAMSIPLSDRSFDVVVCQFGIMFFPDKLVAAKEVKRILKPGGTFLFNTWESLDKNPVMDTARAYVYELYPDNPPLFYTVPYHYHVPEEITAMLKEAGFTGISITPVTLKSRSRTARGAAEGLVLGNPMSLALTERGADKDKVVDEVERRLAKRFGNEPMEAEMGALVVEAR